MMQWLIAMLPGILLAFCRITAFFVSAPVFSMRGIPMQFRIGLACFITLIAFMAMDTQVAMTWSGAYPLAVIKEVLIGLALGFTAYLFFTVFQIAGSFVDIQMGFGIVNVIDPMTGAQAPILGNFKYYIAFLLFLTMNGHHFLLLAIMNSFQYVPLDGSIFTKIAEGGMSTFFIETFVVIFTLAFQLAVPLVATLFLVDVGLGLLARTAPQFNMFVVGIPIKIIVGFVMFAILIPGFAYLFGRLFEHMFAGMERLLSIFAA